MFGVILLPNFALQAALRHRPDHAQEPFAILTDEIATKLVVWQVNAPAEAVGVQTGMTSSQALARCGSLRLLSRATAQEETVTGALMESAFACSPWVEATGEGVCTFELRTVHFDSQTLGRTTVDHLKRLGLHAQVGIADNPDLALLVALAAKPVLVVTESHEFLAGLPVAALHPTPKTAAILHKWGIETLGALTALPADAVTRRLGVEGHELWLRAAGRQRRLLRLASAPVTFEEAMDFEYEVQTLEPLLFVLRRFIEQLVVRLDGIYRVPETLTLLLRFEDGTEYCREFHIPALTSNIETLFRVVHTHLENFTAPACITRLHLAATPALPPHDQFGLFDAGLRDPNRFSETLARLHALLGADSVGVAFPLDTHRPDRFRLDAPDFLHVGDAPVTKDRREPPARGLPLRRWRPPLPVQIEVEHRCPVRLRSQIVQGAVRAVHGPFQFVGGWWERQSAWTCEEWDVELAQGGLYRVSRQGDDWFLEGTYD